MERIEKYSSLNETPTSQQMRTITRYCAILHIDQDSEPKPSNRHEARDSIYQLRARLMSLNKSKKRSNTNV